MFSLFGNKKTYHADINSAQSTVEIAPGSTLLSSALEAGVPWPHNCRVGSCGTCRCRLVEGKIKELNDFSYVLDEDELDQGMILACQTRALSDLQVTVTLDESIGELQQAQTVDGVISHSNLLTHDIMEIHVDLDNALPAYKAGQYAEISVEGIDAPRSYSFACAPDPSGDSRKVVFYVRHVPNGEMTTWLHAESRTGVRVSVEGPHGTFFLRSADTPVLCIAGGSGLAPIKALLEHLVHEELTRPVTFLFGARTQKDLYCLTEIENIGNDYKGPFEFVPILSEEPEDSDWAGLRGLVTEFIGGEGSDLSDTQAYLCGPPPMIDSAIEVLATKGVSDDRIFFDKFLDASHSPRN